MTIITLARSGVITADGFPWTPNFQKPYVAELIVAYFEYTSVGPPTGVRQLRFAAFSEDTTAPEDVAICATTGFEPQPNNRTESYCLFPHAYRGVVQGTLGGDLHWCPWPPGMLFTDDDYFRLRVTNIAVPNDTVRVYAQFRLHKIGKLTIDT